MSKAKRLQVLLKLELRSSVRQCRPSADRLRARRLRPSASAFPTRPSRTRGRRRLRERPGTPRALRKSCRLREGLRGFRPPACLQRPSAASRPVQLRAVGLACRGIFAAVRRLVSPFSFSRLSLVHLRPNLRPCPPVHRPALSQNRSPRTFANCVHIGSRQSSRRRSGTRLSSGAKSVAVSFGPLCFECGNAGFKCRDSVGGFLAENVGPILHNAQSPRRNDVTRQRNQRRQDEANLFGVKPGGCWNAGSVASFAECKVAGRTGDSGERFPKARRLRKGDQLGEFRRPSAAPKKKTAAVGSFRLAAFGQLPCVPSV